MKERVQLDRGSIVKAGLALASAPGATAVSIRDLGKYLGCDHTAVYRHVRNKDELMRMLLDEVIQQAVAPVAVSTLGWRERLQEFASNLLRMFVVHPSIGAEAVVLTTYGPGELDAMELMLQSFQDCGLEGDELVQYYGLFSTHVLSRAAGIARSRAARSVAVDNVVPWMDAPILADPSLHLAVHQYRSTILSLVDDQLYRKGVELILDSAEVAAQS